MRSALVVVVWLSAVSSAQAQLDVTSTVNVDFETFTGAGLQPSPTSGQLDSEVWRLTGFDTALSPTWGATLTTGDFARGEANVAVTTSGVYALDTGGNVVLGVQPGASDFTPGAITLRLSNTSGREVSGFELAYEVWTYNDQGMSSSLEVAWSVDDTVYTPLPSLTVGTADVADALPTWQAAARATEVPVLIPSGGFFYIRWTGDDLAGTGSRDEIGLDEVSVTLADCGNGLLDVGEECDDGLPPDGGDGCGPSCQEESGFDCNEALPTVCTNIDECAALSDDCDSKASCEDIDGSFDCPCPEGYAGDGHDPLGEGTGCIDIDECAAGELNDCVTGAACMDADGGFTCTCPEGYTGNGHEVASGGSGCADVDECLSGTHACSADATCDNLPGGYLCTCNVGFAGNGEVCVAACVEPCGDEDCGDGQLDEGEACDDGDSSDGDGCSASCTVEAGYGCSGEPSACAVIVEDDESPDDDSPDNDSPPVDDNEEAKGGGCASTAGSGGLVALLILAAVNRKRFMRR